MLPGLRAVRGVDAVVVDRMRWWRTQRGTAAHTTAAPVGRRGRSHTAPLHNATSRQGASVRRPPHTVVAVRNPKLLVFMRGEASVEHRDAVQMALRELEGDVWLARLPSTERDFYSGQLRPCRHERRCGFSILRERSRRRAASVPALPFVSLNVHSGKNIKNSSSSSTSKARREGRNVSRYGVRRSVLANNKESVSLPALLQPAHQCHRVECLQDSYVFHPEADYVGDGAFSRVFRAMPIFRGSPSDTFFAIKVIPRHRGRRPGLLTNFTTSDEKKKKRKKKKGQYMDRLSGATAAAATEGPSTLQELDRPVAAAVVRSRGGAVIYHRGSVEEQEGMHRELVEIEREISTIRRLHHNSCSQFVEALRTPDEYVIVMNMGKGSLDTRRYLQMYGSPSEVRVALILYQLVGTVNYLQQHQGLIHRDIKLENVLLSRVNISRDRIRQILGEDVVEQTHSMTHERTSHDYNTQEDGEGKEEDITKSKQYRCHKGETNKEYTHSPSMWGSFSYRKIPEELDQLLKVTLIDFGLARRTRRRHERHCGRTLHEGASQRSGLQRSGGISNHEIRRGMPTPLPSALNMFVSVDSESSFCASSTNITPSVTPASSSISPSSSCSALSSAASADDVTKTDITPSNSNSNNSNSNHGHDVPATLEEGNGSNTGDLTRMTQDSVLSTADVPLTAAEGGEVTAVSSTSREMFTELPATQQDFLSAAEADVTSMRGFNTRAMEDPLNPAAVPIVPVSHNTQVPGANPHIWRAENTETHQRSCWEDPAEDGDSMLFLTPCGTDKYLPPEMLRWIVSHGWERKPTPVRLARKLDAYAIGIVAYVLLSGCFPFNGASRASMAQQQQRCTPKCNSEHWRHISNDAISFVQSLLEPDPEVRSSVAAALVHPWLRRVARLAEKLGLIPMPEDEAHICEKAYTVATSTSQSAPLTSPQRTSVQPQESTTAAHRYSASFPFRGTHGFLQETASCDDGKHIMQRSHTNPYLTPHCPDAPTQVPLTSLLDGEKGGNKELYTTTTATTAATAPTTQALRNVKESKGCLSPAQTLTPVPRPSTMSPTATKLLEQIAATHGLRRDDSTATVEAVVLQDGTASHGVSKRVGRDDGDWLKDAKKEEMEAETDEDPFARMFKTVMSE